MRSWRGLDLGKSEGGPGMELPVLMGLRLSPNIGSSPDHVLPRSSRTSLFEHHTTKTAAASNQVQKKLSFSRISCVKLPIQRQSQICHSDQAFDIGVSVHNNGFFSHSV